MGFTLVEHECKAFPENLLYSVKKKTKKTENKNSKVFKTKNGRFMLKSICSVCNNKKSRFISKNEGSGLLSSLGIKTPLSKVPLLNVLF